MGRRGGCGGGGDGGKIPRYDYLGNHRITKVFLFNKLMSHIQTQQNM
jgi:hypothetical protein